jgi:hypothetical protein
VHAIDALDVDERAEFAFQLSSHWRRSHRSAAHATARSVEYLELVAIRR